MSKIGIIPKGAPRIVVVIPYRKGARELAKKAALIHHSRAGLPCEVHYIEDVNQEGWVSIQNNSFKKLKFDYYVYSCDDYFPGRDYLFRAMSRLYETGKKVLAFNDGKWFGALATAALVRKSFVKLLPYDTLFWSEYFMSYADTELTDWAITLNELEYRSDAILMEIDYYKESDPHVNVLDREKYNKRTGFVRNFK